MDKVKEKLPFDLSSVDVGGVIVDARPIEWDAEMVDGEGHNAAGEYVKPVKYETACPHCGQLIQFTPSTSIKCQECRRGTDVILAEFIPEPFESPFCNPGDYVRINPQLQEVLAELQVEVTDIKAEDYIGE